MRKLDGANDHSFNRKIQFQMIFLQNVLNNGIKFCKAQFLTFFQSDQPLSHFSHNKVIFFKYMQFWPCRDYYIFKFFNYFDTKFLFPSDLN